MFDNSNVKVIKDTAENTIKVALLIMGEIRVAPVPKQSVRAASSKGKIFFYKPKAVKAYEKQVIPLLIKSSNKPKDPLDGNLYLEFVFIFQHPKSFSKRKKKEIYYKNTKPDITNLNKNIEDVLQEAEYIINDSRAVMGANCKIYGPRAKTIFKIYRLIEIIERGPYG